MKKFKRAIFTTSSDSHDSSVEKRLVIFARPKIPTSEIGAHFQTASTYGSLLSVTFKTLTASLIESV